MTAGAPVARRPWDLPSALVFLLLLVGVALAGLAVHSDFGGFYGAARALRRGLPGASLYEWPVMRDVLAELGVDAPGALAPNPPPLALPYLSVSFLPPRAAQVAWALGQAGLLAVAVLSLARATGTPRARAAIAVLLLPIPALTDLAFGQSYGLLLALVAGGAALFASGRQVAAGLLLGCAAALKITPAVFVLPFAVIGAWRVLVGAAVAAASLFGAAGLLGGAPMLARFFVDVAPASGWTAPADAWAPAFQSLTAFLHQLLVPDPGRNPSPPFDEPVLAARLLAVERGLLLGLALAAWRRLRDEPRALWDALGLAAAVHLALAPSSGTYHALFLVLAALPLLGLPRAATGGREVVAAGLDRAALVCVVVAGLPPQPLLRLAHGWTLPLAYPRLWACTLLAALLGARLLAETAPAQRLVRVGLGLCAGLLLVAASARPAPTGDDGARLVDETARYAIAADPEPGPGGLFLSTIGPNGWEVRGPHDFLARAARRPVVLANGTLIYERVEAGRRWLAWRRAGHEERVGGSDGCRDPARPPDRAAAAVLAACPDGIRVLGLGGDDGRILHAGHDLRGPIAAAAGRLFWVAEGHLVTVAGPLTVDATVVPPLASSPDGTQLAFSAGGAIHVLDVASGQLRALTRRAGHPGDDGEPAFRPDGSGIVFAGARGPGVTMRRIYEIPLETVARR